MRPVPDSIGGRLEPAATVFARRGFDQTRIEDIAEATGVPRATLYYYFAGKEEILAWLLRRTLEATAQAVAVAVALDANARERLEAVVVAQLRTMAAHPDCCTALAAESGRIMRMPELAAAVQGGFHHPVRRLLEEGAADGSLRGVESAETTASSIYGAVIMAGLHYLVAEDKLDPDKIGAQVATLLFGGLAP